MRIDLSLMVGVSLVVFSAGALACPLLGPQSRKPK